MRPIGADHSDADPLRAVVENLIAILIFSHGMSITSRNHIICALNITQMNLILSAFSCFRLPPSCLFSLSPFLFALPYLFPTCLSVFPACFLPISFQPLPDTHLCLLSWSLSACPLIAFLIEFSISNLWVWCIFEQIIL